METKLNKGKQKERNELSHLERTLKMFPERIVVHQLKFMILKQFQ